MRHGYPQKSLSIMSISPECMGLPYPLRVIGWGTVDGTHCAAGKGTGVKIRGLLRVRVVSEADRRACDAQADIGRTSALPTSNGITRPSGTSTQR